MEVKRANNLPTKLAEVKDAKSALHRGSETYNVLSSCGGVSLGRAHMKGVMVPGAASILCWFHVREEQ